MNRKITLVLIVFVIVAFGAFWGFRKLSPGDVQPVLATTESSDEAPAQPVPGDEITPPAKPVVCVDIVQDQIVEVDGVPTLPCVYPADGERCAIICHVPNADPGAKHSILISFEAMKAHMSAHEDGSDSQDVIGLCSAQDTKACTEAAADM